MATDLHTLTAPVFIRALTNLDKILDKGRAFAADKGSDEQELLDARLIGDMGNLISQIQRASDSAKGCMVRLGGAENVVMEDNEASFDDLKARIARTIDFVKSVPADAINGKEDAEVVLTFPNGELKFDGRSYVLGFVHPNFYFHVTTAYALLRMKGVPIGKIDFLGGV
ncbi:DUF1993 domain-containing protein [Sphingomonas sp.]|jgi:hypothetical protein|uniref:DUF1993 domain-containing protein n=1 Tax=Sphingomonas sp. TaxID=28214 RepID=UPI002E32ABC7|nr:DUF1993 domain-containing protein [Sphingomonas sp.]HEX4693157.1 DUF1993 domain-containing protein [Sphingomonas sp.]